MEKETDEVKNAYDSFIRRGLNVGFTDDQIDFLWAEIIKIAQAYSR